MTLDFEKFKSIFFSESHELLDAAEKDIYALDQKTAGPDTLNSLFRSIHTLKGNGGIFNFKDLVASAHSFESYLQKFRESKEDFSSRDIAFCYQEIRKIRSLVESVEKNKVPHKPSLVPSSYPYIKVPKEKVEALLDAFGDVLAKKTYLSTLFSEMSIPKLSLFSLEFEKLKRQIKALQRTILAIRTQPISTLFSRFPQAVQQASEEVGKDIKLVIEGHDIEVDTIVLEGLLEPLIHILRNAVDHGIEAPSDRQRSGKPLQGNIFLSCRQEYGRLIVEVKDDGQGINIEKIRSTALKHNLLQQNQEPQDLTNLIFLPGFSTQRETTTVSGRGIGMDSVKSSIERLGGSISLHTEEKKGTTILLSLPLSLAVTEGLVVRVGKQIFIIPIEDVYEILPYGKRILKDVNNSFKNDRHDLPLTNLHAFFQEEQDQGSRRVVIISRDKNQAFLIDALIGRQQVIIKNLEHHYRDFPAIGGATHLGDGSIALVLDLNYFKSSKKINDIKPYTKRIGEKHGKK